MYTFIADRVDDYDAVVGNKKVEKPDYIAFFNADKALKMLHKHITGDKPIAGHGDVDIDGIGSTYILYKFLLSQGALSRAGFLINREKDHGVSQRHVDYFAKSNTGLLIILDSGTNDIDYIKQMNCDVLVVDHHEVLHNELSGKTVGGEYVIVNNMIDNLDVGAINEFISNNLGGAKEYVKPYYVEERMSGGLVLYELLRLYQLAYNTSDILETAMLYQWVGITLLTDVVPLSNSRNQYYMEKTVHSLDIEPSLKIIMNELNPWAKYLSKSFINFTLAPMLNRAIRAGESAMALDIILNRPHDIRKLEIFKDSQKAVMDSYLDNTELYDTYVVKDITNTGISKSYCGVLATRLCEETNKNAAVYLVIDGIAEGSFRGRLADVDYRKFFEDYREGIYAQGHKTAFGFKVKVNELKQILEQLPTIESSVDTRPYVTMGDDIPLHERGKYHISDIDEFKRQGLLWQLAVANSKLSSEESISIVALSRNLQFIEQKGSAYKYRIFGLTCISFETINTKFVEIYIEYSGDVNIYVRNIKD